MTNAILAFVMLLASMNAIAQPAPGDGGWPSRPIRLIVTAAPGSAGDTVCRIMAQELSERLGQQFVFDN